MPLDGHGPNLVLHERRFQPFSKSSRIAYRGREKDELGMRRHHLKPGDHARKSVASLVILQHVHFVDDYRTHLS